MEIELINKAISIMKKEPAFLKLHGKIMIAGDTHADIVMTKEIASKFFNGDYDKLIFLGDYVDRAPEDVGSSFPNINYLIKLKVEAPSKVFLLKGNHETGFAIPFWPNEFEHELMNESMEMRKAYINLFKEMPLMAMLNNIYASHAGFPSHFNLSDITKTDKKVIEEVVWSDVDISPVFRGIGKKFGKNEMQNFLDNVKANAFIRGHDPNLNGVIAYEKCLTIMSCRQYMQYGNGGVLVAIVDDDIDTISDIKLEEWRNGIWKKYTPLFFNE